jgi:hypothetical protein
MSHNMPAVSTLPRGDADRAKRILRNMSSEERTEFYRIFNISYAVLTGNNKGTGNVNYKKRCMFRVVKKLYDGNSQWTFDRVKDALRDVAIHE